jgi:hypothetical protein
VNQRYRTPQAAKMGIEDRLRKKSAHRDLGRVRQVELFHRLVARLAKQFGQRLILKGGFVLEIRLARARTTLDVDVLVTGDPSSALEELQSAGRLDLGDYLSFEISRSEDQETIEGDGIVYEGRRFRVQAMLAGLKYGDSFGLDVAYGDIVTGKKDTASGSDFFSFIGAEQVPFQIYPRETHLAEKLHAYTLPRKRPNSRVKDLPDMALLAQTGPIEATVLRAAFECTFDFRGSHALPSAFPEPPTTWTSAYAKIAKRDGLPWTTLDDLVIAVRRFVEPVLLPTPTGRWSPAEWTWTTPH